MKKSQVVTEGLLSNIGGSCLISQKYRIAVTYFRNNTFFLIHAVTGMHHHGDTLLSCWMTICFQPNQEMVKNFDRYQRRKLNKK